MKQVALLFLLAFGLNATAQKTFHDANAEIRNVGSFRGISVSGGFTVYLSEGTEAVAVSGRDASIMKSIKVEVVDGILKIGYDYDKIGGFTKNRQLRAYVSFKTLQSLSASGGSDVFVDGSIKTADLNMSISGGSDFKGKINVDNKLQLSLSGGSDMDVSGSAGTAKISASGGSDLDGYGLVTDKCQADASGGSDIRITVNKEISADVSGGSDVFYKGAAAELRISKSGGSSVLKSQ